MAVTYGFYNSLNKDRVYNAEQMSAIFDGVITDGVFASIADHMMPVAGTGLQVIVKPGKCWFNHTWTLNDAELPLTIATADVSLTRIDAIVVEINSAASTRANTIKVVKGIPSANPTKPTMLATETLHQYALGYVKVTPGMTSVTADKIEVNVGKSTCPFATSILQQTDITDLFNQWDAEFNTWFKNVQSQLSGDIAANLQRQIDENYANTLKPATAAMFGLSADAIPDAVLAWLGKYNQHWWSAKMAGSMIYRHSADRNAYPDDGMQDGYEYKYLGIPFDNVVTAPKIETGKYRGAGYGPSNPTSITFSFIPKVVILASNSPPIVLINPMIASASSATSDSSKTTNFVNLTITWSGKAVSWHVPSDSTYDGYTKQMVSGYYVAFG